MSLAAALSWTLWRSDVSPIAPSDCRPRPSDESRSLQSRWITRHNPDQRVAYYFNIALAEAMAGRFAAAIATHRFALEIMPEFTHSRYQLACLLAHVGEIEEASRLFSENIPVMAGNGEIVTTSIVRFEAVDRSA